MTTVKSNLYKNSIVRVYGLPVLLMVCAVAAFFALITSRNSASGSPVAETVDFSLPGIDGKQRKLSDYRGKWVVVNYWATWCPPCLEEIPELVNFYEDHKDKNAVVIGVNFEDIDIPQLKTFVDDYFMSYPIVHSKPAARSDLGLISGLPTSFLISPDGKLVAKQTGPVTADMINGFIKEYANGKR
jgi:thiol-disulfide isomerase/thioredoxin